MRTGNLELSRFIKPRNLYKFCNRIVFLSMFKWDRMDELWEFDTDTNMGLIRITIGRKNTRSALLDWETLGVEKS